MIGPLTKIEGRILGTLIEKENLVPGIYPLSFKRVMMGVNQHQRRNPRMYVTEPECQQALDSLLSYGLIESTQSRDTIRYHHVLWKPFKLAKTAIPILGILLLMGPQTANEIRLNIARVYNFADAEVIKGALRHMSDKHREDPLVQRIPPIEGEREERWAQLLTGKIELPPSGPILIENLQREISSLRERICFLEDRLGIRSKVL
jgi:uncharacterized protein